MDEKPATIALPIDLRILRKDVLHFREIDSTNRYLLEKKKCQHGTVVLADYQTAGRGRFDRVWLSPKEDALLFSILLKEFPRKKTVVIYPFLAALGVVRGLQGSISGNVNISVKWPNDILLNHKKVCGILVQSKIVVGQYERIVIGIGLNANQTGEFFKGDLIRATSVFNETGEKHDRIRLFEQILLSIDRMLILLQKNGERPIIEMWEDVCDSLGKEIAIDDGGQVYRGVFEGLENDGAMRLVTKNGHKVFYAGDVTVLKE